MMIGYLWENDGILTRGIGDIRFSGGHHHQGWMNVSTKPKGINHPQLISICMLH